MDIGTLIFQLLVLLFSVVIHEVSHGAMANYLGDPTAKNDGRLTLNPLVHLDLWGSVIVPVVLFIVSAGGFVFGYAKPVPFNPYNLRNQKYGPALVGAAGPGANFAIALVFGLVLRFGGDLIGIRLAGLLAIIVLLNLVLGVFNLVPIPPLDGSKILFAFLPDSFESTKESLEHVGPFVLLFFIFFAFGIILPLVAWLFQLVVGTPFLFFLR